MKNISKTKLLRFLINTVYITAVSIIAIIGCTRSNCPPDLDLQPNQLIEEFHQNYFQNSNIQIQSTKFSIFLDYSSSMRIAFADKKTESFYELFINSLKISNVSFFEVANQEVTKIENVDKSELYKKIKATEKFNKVNAPLNEAVQKIVQSNEEAVFITDGELWDNGERDDPWAREEFGQWLKAGNTIDFFVTDHIDAGKMKHVFYMFFIPAQKLKDKNNFASQFNYYLSNSLEAKELKYARFSFSNNQIVVSQEYKTQTSGGANDDLELDPTTYVNKGLDMNFEYLEVLLPWKDINKFIAQATDDNGNPLKGGAAFLSHLMMDLKGLEFYDVNEFGLNVYDVGSEYQKLKKCKEATANPPVFEKDENGKVLLDEKNQPICSCFGQTDCYNENGKLIIDSVYKPNLNFKLLQEIYELDQEAFLNNIKNQGKGEIIIRIHKNFNGSPLSTTEDNLHRIDVCLKKVTPRTQNPNLEKFIWQGKQVEKNRSIYNSILGALNDANPEGKVIYSFYVKTFPNDK